MRASFATDAKRVWEALKLATPGLAMTQARALELLEQHVPSTAGLADVNAGDLLLALAALEEDAAAVAEVDRRLVAVCRALAPRDLELEEFLQRARLAVFVGPPPKLKTYSGRGALVPWLRAVCFSVLAHARRRPRREEGLDSKVFRLVDAAPSPETKLTDRRRAEALGRALEAALATLSPKERTMLRMRYVDGLPHDHIARAFGQHRTSALRALERLHEVLMERVLEHLRAAKLGSSDFGQLSRLIDASFPQHLSQLLATRSGG